MAIDFTKLIQDKITKEKFKVIYCDEFSTIIERCGVIPIHLDRHIYFRTYLFKENFENFENVPVEPKKFKVYVGLKKLNGMDRIDASIKKENLVDNGFEQIQEVEFISGEGNN
jgi:hypothetical protein